MADREERRFAEVSRDSVKLMAESTGVELGDDVAALLAEDVCYRLREATQVSGAPPEIYESLHHMFTRPSLVWTHTEQLPVHETCQEEEADSGGLQQSSALEQRGGEDAESLPVCLMICTHTFSLFVCVCIRLFVATGPRTLYLSAQ